MWSNSDVMRPQTSFRSHFLWKRNDLSTASLEGYDTMVKDKVNLEHFVFKTHRLKDPQCGLEANQTKFVEGIHICAKKNKIIKKKY